MVGVCGEPLDLYGINGPSRGEGAGLGREEVAGPREEKEKR